MCWNACLSDCAMRTDRQAGRQVGQRLVLHSVKTATPLQDTLSHNPGLPDPVPIVSADVRTDILKRVSLN